MSGAVLGHAGAAGWAAPMMFLPMFFFFAGLVFIRMALKDPRTGRRQPHSAFLARRKHPLAHVRPSLTARKAPRTSSPTSTRKPPHRRSGPRRLTSV